MRIPIQYDPLIAKLVVWGSTRGEAIARARRALLDYHVVGVPTSIPFFLAAFDDPSFVEGRYDTGFVTAEWLDANVRAPEVGDDVWIAGAVQALSRDLARRPGSGPGPGSEWKRSGGWRGARGMRS
jgi:acetyl/propionyl-CoA carboxylase alpha subunit